MTLQRNKGEKMRKAKTAPNKKLAKTGYLARFSSYFFAHARLALLGVLILLVSGGAVYSSIIKREGFPPIQFPLGFVSGFYAANDKDVVDSQLAQPFYDAVSQIEGVDTVQTTSNANDFNGVVYFDESVTSEAGAQAIQEAIAGKLPAEAQVQVLSIDPSAYLNKYDMLLSVYAKNGASPEELQAVADGVAGALVSDDAVAAAESLSQINELANPQTGQIQKVQTSFNRVAFSENEKAVFYDSVLIGVNRTDDVDVIELSEAVTGYLAAYEIPNNNNDYQVVIGADFAESIKTQISSLESNLITGLIAVALVTLLLITWRASIITAIFMVTVMALTILVLYIVGYTLNTITLFALVLSLGLFVDDATIVVESIDAANSKKKKPKDIVREAISKIGAASFAGSFTTILVFLPLAFISGILGEFIRLMPITVIISLLSSLLLSLTLIPVLSKYLILRPHKISWITRMNPVSNLESWLAHRIGELPRLLKKNKKVGRPLSFFLFSLSILGLGAALTLAGQVPFNIFPASKDSDQIGVSLSFAPGDIAAAKQTSSEADAIIADELGALTRRVTYGSYSIVQPNARSADILIDLVPFNERDEKSPELIARLQTKLDAVLGDKAKIKVSQFDAGPPTDDYPFKVQVYDEDAEKAVQLAMQISDKINGAEITRASGGAAKITDVNEIKNTSVSRADGKRFVEVSASFDADDVSALLMSAQEYTENIFTDEYLRIQGFESAKITYDFGQESENADSFAALGLVFPIALLSMFVLLALQFRSFLQPLLIFMAIPFTFLGVFGGLNLTDNSLSFFVMVGLIGLIGIAVNNTILLTTYANQEREAGESPVDAISNAVTKRFRPLLATTTTTVVALLPLALADPFWEALAFTIIFGLISSTFFVLISFPYYYLVAEKIRAKVSFGLIVKRFKKSKK